MGEWGEFGQHGAAANSNRYTSENLDIRSPLSWQGNCFVFVVVRSHGKT